MAQATGELLIKRARRPRLARKPFALLVGDVVSVGGHLVQPAHHM